MKLFLLLLITLSLLASMAVADEPRDPAKDADPSAAIDFDEVEAITAWLSHYHRLPTAAELERVSPRAREIVFEIALDEDAFLFHRHRAIHALSHWPDHEVFDFLSGLLTDDATDEGLKHHLVMTLARGFGDRAVPLIEPFLLTHEDPQLRISAAAALAKIDGDASHQILLRALEQEENSIVRSRIEHYATRIR
jgi:hypothetical protein